MSGGESVDRLRQAAAQEDGKPRGDAMSNDGIYQQNPDGSYSPAQPIGWQEEHGLLARFLFWLRRVEHCNDREGQRR